MKYIISWDESSHYQTYVEAESKEDAKEIWWKMERLDDNKEYINSDTSITSIELE